MKSEKYEIKQAGLMTNELRFLPFSTRTLEEIAKLVRDLTPREVLWEMKNGRAVYSRFSKFSLLRHEKRST